MNITPISRTYGRYIYGWWGYKPTYKWGVPHCRGFAVYPLVIIAMENPTCIDGFRLGLAPFYSGCSIAMFHFQQVLPFLVGGLEHEFYFSIIWDNPSHWLIFFRGVGIPPTSFIYNPLLGIVIHELGITMKNNQCFGGLSIKAHTVSLNHHAFSPFLPAKVPWISINFHDISILANRSHGLPLNPHLLMVKPPWNPYFDEFLRGL